MKISKFHTNTYRAVPRPHPNLRLRRASGQGKLSLLGGLCGPRQTVNGSDRAGLRVRRVVVGLGNLIQQVGVRSENIDFETFSDINASIPRTSSSSAEITSASPSRRCMGSTMSVSDGARACGYGKSSATRKILECKRRSKGVRLWKIICDA